MKGRIARPEQAVQLELPEIGRLHIGMKTVNKYGKEIPTSVDYFIPAGKYAALFTQALGDKPNTISIIFPDDDAEKVCNERYVYRNDKGELIARGNGRTFEIWNGTKYVVCTTDKIPDIMQQVTANNPKKTLSAEYDGWDIELTLRFIIPAVRGVVGVWILNTKGRASSIKNISNSFDSVKAMRGTVTTSVFDLAVHFHKSNKPNQNSRYPVLELVCNDNRIGEIRELLKPENTTKNLLLHE